MAIYTDQMFNTAGESTTLAQMNAGTSATTGAYRAKLGGSLLRVDVLVGEEAATSLVEDVRVEMTCTIWFPNTLMFGAQGSGVRTAPAFPLSAVSYVVDQKVETDKDITANYIHDSGVPVTSRIRVFGTFRA